MWPRFQSARLVQGVFVSSGVGRLLYELSEEEAKEIGHTVGSSFKVSGNAAKNRQIFKISSSNHSSMIGTTMISKKTTKKNVNGHENGKETKLSDHMMTLHEVISDWNVMVVLMMLLKCHCKER